ncbi:hypothetical protein DFH27DRAFT_386757 [Peziza echinospora]|nr:hypothetical protein DFH27DRAFT_386757 [Peziza echinospora]
MDPKYADKKIADMSEEELVLLGFLGEGVAPGIQDLVRAAKANPRDLGSITCFMADCLKRVYQAEQNAAKLPAAPAPPTSPTLSDTETLWSGLGSNSEALAVVAPDMVSKYEMHFYYHGIGDLQLMWRSDLQTNPFPKPVPGARFYKIPTKTAHGVFGTPLNAVWDNVAPLIIASLKVNGLQYSAVTTARFSSVEDGKGPTLGPVVVWIALRPGTAKPRDVCDATPTILQILSKFNITDVVVEWYEGLVVRLGGPPLMRVVKNINARFGLNTPFNTGLGIPIARQSDDAHGTLTLLFKEVKTSSGEPSNRVLALTSKHVASVATTTDYELDEANPQHILVCGERRFGLAITEIEKAAANGFRDVVGLHTEVEELEKAVGTDEEDVWALDRKRNALKEKNEDHAGLSELFDEVKRQWKDSNGRRLGVVDWAPKIDVTVDERKYTRDIATFAVDEKKLINFERNSVDLGNQYTARELEDLFWPLDAVRQGRKIPTSLQLPIRSIVPRRRVLNPDTMDKNGNPLYIVGKYGNATKLTLGRYSGMEGYICQEFGLESREVVVYNLSKTSGDFSDQGDSGSLIFTGDGSGLAMLHSGMPRGMHNHVTFGTPMWWVIKQVCLKYRFAEFCGIAYTFEK